MYREGADYCDSIRDYVSRDLFVEVLRDEEGHIDFLETQFEMIARMGLQNYIQLHSNAAEAH
jgi:bacterioferritin